ncbi:MAG: hypothetical protein GEU80_06365 [Dehalococcoidia bacterium]|nr:hypothetical protein [Dehalococcoidia bacterium]
MYRRILVALDGSKHAASAVVHARELARGGSTGVVLLHVVHRDGGQSAEDAQEAARQLGYARTQLQATGIADIEVLTVEGDSPGPAIIEQSERLGCQAIVMATRGQTEDGGNLLGSVAEYVLRHSRTAAVLMAGPAQSEALIQAAIRETEVFPIAVDSLPKDLATLIEEIAEGGTGGGSRSDDPGAHAGPLSYEFAAGFHALRACDVCSRPIIVPSILVERLLLHYGVEHDPGGHLEDAIRTSGLETESPYQAALCSYHQQVSSE